MAAGPDGCVAGGGSGALEVFRPRVRFGRGPVDDHGGDRGVGAGAGVDDCAVRTLLLTRRRLLCRQSTVRDAVPVRRTRGTEVGRGGPGPSKTAARERGLGP